MPVEDDFSLLVEKTAVHRPRVRVDATVKLVRLGVESHEVSSSSYGGLPNASIPRGDAEEGAPISIKGMQATAYSVRCAPASRRA